MKSTMKRIIAYILLLLTPVLALAGCGSSGVSEYKLGTASTAGTYYAYGQKLHELVSTVYDKEAVSVQSTAGSTANVNLLTNGLLDLALVQNDTLYSAYNKKGSFEGSDYTGIRAVAGLYSESCQVVVRADSGIERIEELVGKRVSLGEKESGSSDIAKEVLEAYGISPDQVSQADLSIPDSAKALKNGEIDAYFCIIAAPAATVTELAETTDIRLLPIDERAAKQIMNNNGGFSFSSIPAGTYKGQTEAISTLGVKAVLVANETVSDEYVRALLDVLFSNPTAFEAVSGTSERLTPEYSSDGISIPFHAAAAEWYREKGLTVSDKAAQDAAEEGTFVLKLDMYQTLGLATVALFVGIYLRRKIRFFESFCIPAPVIGGVLFAIVSCILYVTGVIELSFDETLKTVCMVIFFTSVGFQANMKVLKRGGKSLVIFLIAIAVLIIVQNLLATGLSFTLGISPLVGLCTGSIPMVGGHGTAGAFGPLLEDMNITGATTLATAAATFGLIAGSFMGGPLANRLISKKDLVKTAIPVDGEMLTEDEIKHGKAAANYAKAAYQLAIAMGIGTVISKLLTLTGMTFPIYIGSMIVAAIMRNISEYSGKFKIEMDEIDDIGGICLSLFLGVAMITLKLWQLADLALPLFILLIGQTVLMFLFARFVIFTIMGRNYDAAVLSAGTCGFGMGATPNAMANMQAVTQKYVPSVQAYILVPIVGSMFADFINSLSITFFVNMLG